MDKDRELAKEKVREYGFGEKIRYYWGYYKYRYIFIFLLVCLIGYTAYSKLTEQKYDIEVILVTEDFIDEASEQALEENLSDWLTESKGDGVERFVDVVVIQRQEIDGYNQDAVLAANTKLTSVLASEQRIGFILNEDTYEHFFTEDGYGYLADKNISGEIGVNAVKEMGLSENTKYYYVTAYTKGVEKGYEDALREYENSKIIFNKILELK